MRDLTGRCRQSALLHRSDQVSKEDLVNSPGTNHSTTKMIGYALLLSGTALAVFSLLADWLGVGGGKGFGYQQMIVLIVGIVLILGGIRALAQPFFNRFGRPHDLAEMER